jgi:hypothetical protein
LAESLFGIKDYKKSLEYYNYALQYYEKASSALMENNPDRTDLKDTVTNEKQRIKVQLGRCLWEMGEKEAGFSFIAVCNLTQSTNTYIECITRE